MSKNKKEEMPILNEDERAVRYTTAGKANYIYVKPGVTVFDSRGKRKIGKDSRVNVVPMDRVVYSDGNEYVIKTVAEGYAVLKKI